MFDKDSIGTVEDGDYPFYSGEEVKAEDKNKVSLPSHRATSVNDIEAVSYKASGPNKLVATNNSGVLPTSVVQGAANLASYVSNAAALAGGLVAGQFYRNGDVTQVVH